MGDASVDSLLYCAGCGYDLRSIPSNRCPECGLIVDRSTLGLSVIPWLHRARLGRSRAFRQTVRMATFRPRELAKEIACPANFRDAVLFRRAVVLCALVPLGLLASGLYLFGLSQTWGGLWTPQDQLGSALQLLFVPVIWLCLALFLFAVTGVSTYFFHPRSIPFVQQNRAIAISYYACAPLAYAPLTALLFVGGMIGAAAIFDAFRAQPLFGIAWLIALLPLGVQIAQTLHVPVVLLGAATHCGTGRQWGLGIFLFLFWIVAAFVCLVAIPYAAATIGVMIVSLRQS